MGKKTDEILELLSLVPDMEKNAVKRFFNTLLTVALKSSPAGGYALGTSGYVNSIYLAYLQTFFTPKHQKIGIVTKLRTGREALNLLEKNIVLVATMGADEQNEAKDMWKNIAIVSMKNLGYGYKDGTASHVNNQILNYLELYCGINMSKNPNNVFRMPGFDLKIGA